MHNNRCLLYPVNINIEEKKILHRNLCAIEFANRKPNGKVNREMKNM